MPTTYPGNPAGGAGTSPVPALAAVPTAGLPADGDPPNAATFEDGFRTCLDWLAWLAQREVVGPWGDGSDGNATYNTSQALNGTKFFNNLTIGASGLVYFDSPGVCYVKGTLSIASGGVLRMGHPTAMNGGNAAAALGGTNGVGGNASVNASLLGGSNGGDGGGAVPAEAGVALGGALIHSIGGEGGAGGSGGTGGDPGNGGFWAAYSPSETQALQSIFLAGGWGIARGGTAAARTAEPFGLQGGSGGGGGGYSPTLPGATGGGGGGAGGGVLIVIARKVIIGADGALFAGGGSGGNGFSNGGGGGGGGGGGIGLIYGTKTGPALTAAVCTPGGVGGGGGVGNNGVAGAVGTVHEYALGY